ncbi:anti-sigma factor family protein [Acidobacteriota bacterium]
MKCLQIDQIYLYLENELPASDVKKIDTHLSSCTKCRQAVEERRFLLEAAENLPVLETPSDFSRQVMARIFPEKAAFRIWQTAVVAVFSSATLTILAFIGLSGQNLPDFLVSILHALITHLRTLSLFLAKIAKLTSIALKIFLQFTEFLIKGFARLTSIISPEAQIFLFTLTVILFFSFLYGMRRIFLFGVKA